MKAAHRKANDENDRAHSSMIQAQSKPFRIPVLLLMDLELEGTSGLIFYGQKT